MSAAPLLADGYANPVLRGSVINQITNRHRKHHWPAMFWFILKFLGLYYHETVVTKRRCYICRVKNWVTKRRHNYQSVHDMEENLDYLALTYEQSDPALNNQLVEEHCETCESLWWNRYGIPVVYSEQEIGVKHWSHKGSGLFSVILLFLELLVLLYNGIIPIAMLWGKPDQILQLLLKLTLIVAVSLTPIVCMCSKLRSFFNSGVTSKFAWATVFNVRYLIARGQLLDLPRRGLPGKPLLFLCICGPFCIAVYRAFIFLHISECAITPYAVVTSLVGMFFAECWSLGTYLLYFVRVSFQCQFNLLLAYIKENEDNIEKCKGVIMTTASDFGCFRKFCDLVTASLFPTVVLAVAANVTWNYLISKDDCVGSDHNVHHLELYLAIMQWLELVAVVTLYLSALGGFQVTYVWDNFFVNLLHLRGSKDVLMNMKYFVKGSPVLLTSVIFSVIGTYAGIGYSGQAIAFLSQSCGANITIHFCG